METILGNNLYWVDGPWKGKMAMAARPRGGDWLQDELSEWRQAGITTIVSMLEPAEERELDLENEGAEALAQGLRFLPFPIPDRDIPESVAGVGRLADGLGIELASGRNLLLHCRQGVGRSGLIAACLLMGGGLEIEAAVLRLSRARGIPVPETPAQRLWLEAFADTLTVAH